MSTKKMSAVLLMVVLLLAAGILSFQIFKNKSINQIVVVNQNPALSVSIDKEVSRSLYKTIVTSTKLSEDSKLKLVLTDVPQEFNQAWESEKYMGFSVASSSEASQEIEVVLFVDPVVLKKYGWSEDTVSREVEATFITALFFFIQNNSALSTPASRGSLDSRMANARDASSELLSGFYPQNMTGTVLQIGFNE